MRGNRREGDGIYLLGGRLHQGGGPLDERANSEASRMRSSRIYTRYRNVADLTEFVGAFFDRSVRSFLTV
jgi:hypothetical protein